MLELKEINYTPPKSSQPLWSDLSLKLQAGKIYALVGINGVGKTTMLNMISGLIKPTQGEIVWQQQPIHQSAATLRQYLTQVGYCLQSTDHLFFKQTVQEELEYHHNGSIAEVVQQLQLDPLLTSSPFELSGGQKKRLALAIMLLKQPQILLCDEITAGLDAHFQQLVMKILQKYCRQHLVIVVTHNLEEALQYCDQWLFLTPTGLKEYSITTILRQTELFQHWGLRMPSTLAIRQSLVAAGVLPADGYYRSNDEIAAALAKIKNKDQ